MIFDFLFDKEEINYPINLPIDKAVETTNRNVASHTRSANQTAGLVGSVSQNDVFIYHSTGSRRNSFVPTFYGRFSNDGQNSVLTGEITLNKLVKQFMVVWICLVALIWVATCISLFTNPAASWFSLLYVTILLGAAIGFLLFIKSKSAVTKQVLKDHIRSAVASS